MRFNRRHTWAKWNRRHWCVIWLVRWNSQKSLPIRTPAVRCNVYELV